MKKAELIGAGLFFVLGAHVIQQSLQLEIWAKFGPGPGFMPLLIGIFWMVISALHGANVLMHAKLYQEPHPFPAAPPPPMCYYYLPSSSRPFWSFP